MRTIFVAHAAADHEFARRLAEFLEFGCNVTCYWEEGRFAPGQDLISRVADGFTADLVLLLLSEASWPARIPRERWEPFLLEQTRAAGVDLVTILLGRCPYPPLLERRNFIDGTTNPLSAMRLAKRWIWQKEHGMAAAGSVKSSADLDDFYRRLADQAGVVESSGAAAFRFVREAAQEFEAVFWIPCHRRSLAEIAGELGSQLGLTLEGTTEENCRTIQRLLASRRCLLALDFPAAEVITTLIPKGRTSTIVTLDAVKLVETPVSLAYARELVAVRRNAEAYELLYRLLRSGVSTEYCARELIWICEQWGCIEEANSLRFYYGPQPCEQLKLFADP